ncbi:MAG TPA: hypothetical protein QF353_05875 [Gammaproteobacteria bacterium]|nr:hypothetical protein [Gammaproteobacteria bacterium]
MTRPLIPTLINLLILIPFIGLADLIPTPIVEISQDNLIQYALIMTVFYTGTYSQLFLSPTKPSILILCFIISLGLWLLNIQNFFPISLCVFIPYLFFIIFDYKAYHHDIISINYFIFKCIINISITLCLVTFIINNFDRYEFFQTQPLQHHQSPKDTPKKAINNDNTNQSLKRS